MKCTTGVLACDFCMGTGEVEAEAAECRRKGQELRDLR
jgi:hypothetical protein